MKTLIIAGGTGLVGSRLKNLAQSEGYEVLILTRDESKNKSKGYVFWNPAKGIIDKETLIKADYLVNLSGANIAEKAWTSKRKAELISSRIKSTNLLAESFSATQHQLKAVVNASAIGYYESSLTRVMSEDENHANGFMGELCNDWEQAALHFQRQNIRTVIFRIGLVLSKHGGAFKALSIPAKLGMGSYIGSGKQKMPWVHIDDLCKMILFALENEKMKGIYNTTIANAPSNKDFTKTLLKAFNKVFLLLPTPKFLIKLVLGERSDILLLSYNPSPDKLLKTGFKFQHNHLSQAFDSLK